MKKFRRYGTVTRGDYSGGEYYTRDYTICAKANTKKKLKKEVIRLTDENSSDGHKIDFGFVSGEMSVTWESKVLKVK